MSPKILPIHATDMRRHTQLHKEVYLEMDPGAPGFRAYLSQVMLRTWYLRDLWLGCTITPFGCAAKPALDRLTLYEARFRQRLTT